MIAQDPTLFTGTLKFNLDPFNEFSPKVVEELLIKAGLAELMNNAGDEDDGEATESHPETDITS